MQGLTPISYSRWSKESHWYTFWFNSGNRTRATQYFEICSVKSFTYEELTTDIESCLKKVQEIDPEATEKQILELKTYIQYFLEDVKNSEDLIIYEQLQEGVIENPDKFSIWASTIRDKEFKKEVIEGLKVLQATDDDIPLLIEDIKMDLGLELLEKRLKGIVKQITCTISIQKD